MTLRVTWPQALAWRMQRQFIEPLGTVSAVDVVRRLGGVQAQVASSAELAIRLRQNRPAESEISQALADGELIKTWAMRGTLHLFAADEASLYLALIAAGRSWESPAWERYFGLSPARIEGLRDVVREILDGKVLTREEVNAEIVKARGYEHLAAELKSGWGTLFKPLAWQGDICFGPSRGTRVTFARPEQLSALWRPSPPADEAAPVVISRYLASHGPAQPAQVRNWLARGRVSVKQMRHWFSLIGDEVTTVEVEGEEMYIRAEDADSLATAAAAVSAAAAKPGAKRAAVRLLGGFDQWVLGPGTDDPHVIPAGRRANASRAAGWIAPIVIVGGVVHGTWSLDRNLLRVDWFKECGKPPTFALAREVDRLSGLLGRPLDLQLTFV